MELVAALAWVLSEGGAAVIGYWLMETVPLLINLQSEVKRYVAYILTGVIAIVAYLAQIVMAFQEAPTEWRGWVTALFSATATAIIAGQVIHGRMKLSKK